MNKKIILLVIAAFFSTGCKQIAERVEEKKKKVLIADEAAAKAQIKLTARLSEKGAEGKSGSAGNSGAALAALLCSSPKLMEDIEESTALLEALGGEGGDSAELKRQFLASRSSYRAILERELPARGATYAEFSVYALDRGTEQKQKFKALISEKCPRGDKEQVERTAGGLMRYFVQ